MISTNRTLKITFTSCRELNAIAESIKPAEYWKLGEQLGYRKAQLERWERDKGSILKATYTMLSDRLMSDTEWMNTLMTACDKCGLKKISLHLKEGENSITPCSQ